MCSSPDDNAALLSSSLSLSLSWWGGMGLLGDLELFLAQWGRCKLGARLRDTPWSLQLTTEQSVCWLKLQREGISWEEALSFLQQRANLQLMGTLAEQPCYTAEAMQVPSGKLPLYNYIILTKFIAKIWEHSYITYNKVF